MLPGPNTTRTARLRNYNRVRRLYVGVFISVPKRSNGQQKEGFVPV